MQVASLNLGPSQLEKLRRAVQLKQKPSLKLGPEDLNGSTQVHLGKRNSQKLAGARAKSKGVVLHLTIAEMRANRQQGGFLQFLANPLVAALAAPAIGEAGKFVFGKLFGSSEKKEEDKPKQKSVAEQLQELQQMQQLQQLQRQMSNIGAPGAAMPSARAPTGAPRVTDLVASGEGLLFSAAAGSGAKRKKRGGLMFGTASVPNSGSGLLFLPGSERDRRPETVSRFH